MPSKNDKLNSARKNKEDEFYTRYEDVEKELAHYPHAFEGKTVYCNCDDPFKSAFVKYFKEHFNELGLKRLIATCYDGDAGKGETMFLFPRTDDRVAWHFEKTADSESCEKLQYNGDFESEECIELLKQCDIVVTNPPFSLFGEFFSTLIENGVDFIVLGHLTSTTRENVFPYLKSGKVYIDGINHLAEFIGSEKRIAIGWYSTLKSDRKREPLNLTATYTPEHYPRFDNYDAINVSRLAEIPSDYNGTMGVPITFLNKYCSEQFEIIGLGNGRVHFTPTKNYINPIKHAKDGTTAKGNEINRVLAIATKTEPVGRIYYTSDNSDYLVAPYARILIRRKQ